MNLYKKLGLIDKTEIRLENNLKTIEKSLISFKAADSNLFLNQFSSDFNPKRLVLDNQKFKLSKEPRMFNPFSSVGEIDAELFENNERTLVKASIQSYHSFLIFMVVFGLFLWVLVFLFTPKMNHFDILLWFVLYQIIPTIYFFILRNQVKQLKSEFSEFMLKISKSYT